MPEKQKKITSKIEKNTENHNAKVDSNRVIELDDKFLVKWGLKLLSQNRFDHALKIFDHALTLNPYNSDAYYHKGKCLIGLRNHNGGLECLEMAINLKNVELTSSNDYNNYETLSPLEEKIINFIENHDNKEKILLEQDHKKITIKKKLNKFKMVLKNQKLKIQKTQLELV